MSRLSFSLKYLASSLLPVPFIVALVWWFTYNSWEVDGQNFAAWPQDRLIQTFGLAFVLFAITIGLFILSVKLAYRQGKVAQCKALPFATIVGIGLLAVGTYAATSMVVAAITVHLLVIAVAWAKTPGIVKQA